MPGEPASPLFRVRRSRIAGQGAFAIQPIPKGTRIIEYLGERISHDEADRRYEENDDAHVVLFIADKRTVIDANVKGNDARFINHSCDPNCEAVIEKSRVWIEAIRDIAPGEELAYEYNLTRDSIDTPEEEAKYACRCGAPNCRGTMLEKKPKPRRRSTARARERTGARNGRVVT
jgi:SET domain-containing protein